MFIKFLKYELMKILTILPLIKIHASLDSLSYQTPDVLVVFLTAKVMKTLREKVMRTGVTKQRRKRRMKKYLMKCFCTKHFSSKLSLNINMI